jgi:hypothetical protein
MSQAAEQNLPEETRREFVEAASAWLELRHLGEKRSFSVQESHLLAERHRRIIDVLRRMLRTHAMVPALRFRGIIFALAPHPESLLVIEEASIRSVDE